MAPVVLQMEVHCLGCAKKIEKTIKKVPGVTAVKAYVGEGQPGQVVVQGTADAAELKKRLEDKLKKPVVIANTGVEQPAPAPAPAPAAADPQAPPPLPLSQTTGSSSAPINPPPAAQPQHAAPPARPQHAPPPAPPPQHAAPPAPPPPPQYAAPPAPPPPQYAAPPAPPPPQYAAPPAMPPQYAAPPVPPQYGGQQAPRQYGAPPPQDYYQQAQYGGANRYPPHYVPSYFSDDNPNGCSVQ